jgi:phosphoribosylanthranilate isomerase
MNLKIKVCGMREAANIQAVGFLPIHFMGFIFYEKSSRFVTDDIDTVSTCPEDLTRVGVFVDADIDFVLEKIDKHELNAVQLHGQEAPQYLEGFSTKLKEKLRMEAINDIEIIKAFSVDEHFDFNVLKPYIGLVNYFLFDTKTPQHGGSGQKFDWSILTKYDLDIPFLLAGGISEQDVDLVKSLNINQLYGLDLNSKFEISPALKDVEKLRKFLIDIKN